MQVAMARYLPIKAPRQEAVWTAKMRTIALLAALLAAGVTGAGYGAYGIYGGLFALAASYALVPLLIVMATALTWPLDRIGKGLIVRKAWAKLALFPNVKIIGITGSYGKTTMKEAVAAVLRERYVVLASPASVNTPVGIARLILEKLDASTEIFVVEMGAHRLGDIRDLCAITRPDIAVVTGINEAHLERFGSIERTRVAKFEIADCARPGAALVLNADDKRIREEYGPTARGRKWRFTRQASIRSRNTKRPTSSGARTGSRHRSSSRTRTAYGTVSPCRSSAATRPAPWPEPSKSRNGAA